jgi:glucuronokinase
MIIKTVSYPRAALIGNPSDGYFGKTIAFTFADFQADITLYQSPEVEILPGRRDTTKFESLSALAGDVGSFGYYGGVRLVKAAIKKFYDYSVDQGVELDERNFTIRYHSSIPLHLGLAGSSAIITACMRALMAYYSVSIPPWALANLVLSVEIEELGIGAGLQDRVAQAYQGIVYMDFERGLMERRGYGEYEPLRPKKLPSLYIAYKTELSEGSEVLHNDLRYRFNRGDADVVAAMEQFGELTRLAAQMFRSGEYAGLPELMNANFDLRKSITAISKENEEMVDAARSVGASAKFTGSGGAIIGTYTDEKQFDAVESALNEVGARTIRPEIVW